MERLIGDYFEEARGEKRGGETESYSGEREVGGAAASERERERERASERKQKFFTAAQRQIV